MTKQAIVSNHAPVQSTMGSYITGYLASLVLTASTYLLVTHHLLSKIGIISTICILGLVQFAVQLLFFLHIGREQKPRWKLLVFWFMISTVIIIVGGSIWIMGHLQQHTMSSHDLNTYMHDNEGL